MKVIEMKVIFKFDKEEHIYHIDDEELREMKEDYEMNNDEFNNFIRPLFISTYNIDNYGDHYLFGWFESYCQSDSIPHSWWESDGSGSLGFVR